MKKITNQKLKEMNKELRELNILKAQVNLSLAQVKLNIHIEMMNDEDEKNNKLPLMEDTSKISIRELKMFEEE